MVFYDHRQERCFREMSMINTTKTIKKYYACVSLIKWATSGFALVQCSLRVAVPWTPAWPVLTPSPPNAPSTPLPFLLARLHTHAQPGQKIKLRWQTESTRALLNGAGKAIAKPSTCFFILHIFLNSESTPHPPRLPSQHGAFDSSANSNWREGTLAFAHFQKSTSVVCSGASGDPRDLPWVGWGAPSPTGPLDSGLKGESKCPFPPGWRPIPRQPQGSLPSCPAAKAKE